MVRWCGVAGIHEEERENRGERSEVVWVGRRMTKESRERVVRCGKLGGAIRFTGGG